MKGSYLGPNFSQNEIENELKTLNANFELLEEKELIDKTAEALKNGDAVGWVAEKFTFYGSSTINSVEVYSIR